MPRAQHRTVVDHLTPPPPGNDTTPPDTKIDKAPKKKITPSRVKFKFSSSEANSSFECRLDEGGFAACESPRRYKHLDAGKHKFRVRAIDAAGNMDPTPARYRFKVVEKS
jgi:hypothetical protein